MKLFLSSYRIPNSKEFFGLFDGKKPSKLTGGIITNAKDKKPVEERDKKLADLQDYLADMGLKKTVLIDLVHDFSSTQKLGRRLAVYDYLYVAGGNTFDLRRAMKKSGFDSIAHQLADSGQVYIGESAGAIVAGPSLRGFESMDELQNPDKAVWKGLGLIDTVLVPHNDSPDERYRDRAGLIEQANPKFNVVPLNDDQVYVVNGPKQRVV
jgi:dipeptidase E